MGVRIRTQDTNHTKLSSREDLLNHGHGRDSTTNTHVPVRLLPKSLTCRSVGCTEPLRLLGSLPTRGSTTQLELHRRSTRGDPARECPSKPHQHASHLHPGGY